MSVPLDIGNGEHAARVLVIGGGVVGLTTALCLRRRGFQVTLIADRFAPHVTSVVAGALWEWPPAVCGHHHDEIALARAKQWCAVSYERFTELARQPGTGVFLRPVTFYFPKPIDADRRQLDKMHELQERVQGFRRAAALIAEHGVNPCLGLRDAYTHVAPMIDTDTYLPWLLAETHRAGCRIHTRKVTGKLDQTADALLEDYGAAAIVNCTGLGAAELTDDEVYPVRGAIIRVRNDGRAMPRIEQAHCISHNGSSTERGFVFIVPRGDDRLILGGFAEPNERSLDIDMEHYEPIREMHRRCVKFLPSLRNAEIDAAESVRVGLRPFRRGGVRLETEPGAPIVHNYGHGGSGVTYSWGCALEAVERVVEMLPVARRLQHEPQA
jgi:D-amino-acid oxidase